MMIMKPFIVTTIFLLFSLLPAVSDEVVKKNGDVHKGEIIHQDDTTVRLQVTVGSAKASIDIPVSEIKEIRKGKTEREKKEAEFETRLEKAGADIEKLVELAEWARLNRLATSRRKVFQTILKLDPEHKEARLELGYVKYNGKWVTLKEKMMAEGKVFFRGRWIDEEVRDDILRTEAEAVIRRNIVNDAGKDLAARSRGTRRGESRWDPYLNFYNGYLLHRPAYILLPCRRQSSITEYYYRPTLRGRFKSGNWNLEFRF